MFAKKRRFLIILLALAVLMGACALYVGDYYRADAAAIAAFPSSAVPQLLSDGSIVYAPADPIAGFIFYPGGKVEHTAYEPLMQACAARGILCVLTEMPLRLAVLDVNAADGIAQQFPEIGQWYIGGHSLGGSMAASYLAKHVPEYEGLVLLGSYSTADLSAGDVDVLSIYGSEDRVLNAEKYASNRQNLPDDLMELVIEGGCHAFFGMYGAQEGDGMPSITAEAQILQTADAIAQFITTR